MIVMSTGVLSFAHAVHYGVVVGGVVGLVALLAPGWVGRRPAFPRDEHERRVAALQRQIASDSLGTLTAAAPLVRRPGPDPARGSSRHDVLLAVAVVSSTAAAGVHGAMGPSHFRELVLFGLFFAGSAIGQVLWSLAVVLRPSRHLLLVGAVGNAAVIGLWAVTRTLGLPFGLMPAAEAVGPWDLACGAWELVVVAVCLHLLREPGDRPLRVPTWDAWPTSARAFALGSTLALAALTLSGAGG